LPSPSCWFGYGTASGDNKEARLPRHLRHLLCGRNSSSAVTVASPIDENPVPDAATSCNRREPSELAASAQAGARALAETAQAVGRRARAKGCDRWRAPNAKGRAWRHARPLKAPHVGNRTRRPTLSSGSVSKRYQAKPVRNSLRLCAMRSISDTPVAIIGQTAAIAPLAPTSLVRQQSRICGCCGNARIRRP